MKEIRDRYDIFLKVCETGNFFQSGRSIELYAVRNQSDDGRAGGRTGCTVICPDKKRCNPDRQWKTSASVYSGNGESER